jgi:hypothetical protein
MAEGRSKPITDSGTRDTGRMSHMCVMCVYTTNIPHTNIHTSDIRHHTSCRVGRPFWRRMAEGRSKPITDSGPRDTGRMSHICVMCVYTTNILHTNIHTSDIRHHTSCRVCQPFWRRMAEGRSKPITDSGHWDTGRMSHTCMYVFVFCILLTYIPHTNIHTSDIIHHAGSVGHSGAEWPRAVTNQSQTAVLGTRDTGRMSHITCIYSNSNMYSMH